jgi:ribosomal protein S18 acetylase RimI-like enzyme
VLGREVRDRRTLATVQALIRLATPGEADAVSAVVREAYGKWIPLLHHEPTPMRVDYSQVIAAGQAWVLLLNGEIVGVVELRNSPEALVIPNVAVVPRYQRAGHGKRLLTFAEDEAKRRGFGEVRLYVNIRMDENVALYKHAGFAEIERFRAPNGRDYLYMGKRLV